MDLLFSKPGIASQLAVATARGACLITSVIILNVLRQLLLKNSKEPPVVFHWLPFIGSAISYGVDPYKFFAACQKKYGDIFTFVLLGRKTTVYLGAKGNEFILNGKLKDVNAEEIYGPLTTPVFGSDVIYDCPNWKLMEQKKFIKFGLTTEALRSYVPLIEDEVRNYIKTSGKFKGESGIWDVPPAMAEITIFTASRTLQGEEVRAKLNSSFAKLYHDLDQGFTPINFIMPWAPLPRNRKRDAAREKMKEIYMDIIKQRRQGAQKKSHDMIWNLMECAYKDGTPIPDKEIAHMMISLLMAGQHSSSAVGSWIMLHLAANPEIMEELYEEQVRELANGGELPPLQFEHLDKLRLNQNVIKETLRMHSPIHSLMRKVMNPLAIEGTDWVIPPSHVLLASPSTSGKSSENFPDPESWKPHRWDTQKELEDDEKVDYGYGLVSKGAKSPYLPFGAGRHRCIGEKFAYLNLGVIVATMVREFKFSNIDGQQGVVGTDFSSLFSRPLEPAWIKWERRKTCNSHLLSE
ncbi:hypothetical protein VTO42DRAFT_3133 [Malbranchea cinnamomea]